MRFLRHVAPGAGLVLFAFTAQAAVPPSAGVPAFGVGSIVQALLGLLAVLILVVLAAWLLKRVSGFAGRASGPIRVIGGTAVGQRERVVVVEIGSTWLLVGVAPGQVRALHTMPRHDAALASEVTVLGPEAAEVGFAAWLRRMSEKRSGE